MQLFVFVLYVALGIAQISAYLEGIHLWLGVGTLLGLFIFFGTAWLPFGSIADTVIAFYGAYKGWHWPWWQVALLTFPFAILGVVAMSLDGVTGIAGVIFRRWPRSAGQPAQPVAAPAYPHRTSPRIGRRGICVVCGSIKSGSYIPCEECGFQPISDEDLAIAVMLNEATIANFDQIAFEIKSGRGPAFEHKDIEKFITSSPEIRRMLGLKGARYDTRVKTEGIIKDSVDFAVSTLSKWIITTVPGSHPALSKDRLLAVSGVMLRTDLIGRAPTSEKTFIRRFFGKRLVLQCLQYDLSSLWHGSKEEFAMRVAQAIIDADANDFDFSADKFSLEKAVLPFVLPDGAELLEYAERFGSDPYIGGYLRVVGDSHAKFMDQRAASWDY